MSKQSKAKAKAQTFKNEDKTSWEYITSDRLRTALQEAAGYKPPAPTVATNNEARQPGKVKTPLAKPEASVQTPSAVNPEPSPFNPSNALYYGDSIATGLGHGGARGNESSDAMWGRGAADVLSLLNNRPEGTFKGKDVVLSSGVLNSGADWDTVRSQVRLLQNRGANSIRLVGAPSGSDRFSGYNDNLSSISDELGVNFLGGYTPGNDGVHFDYTSSPVYRSL